MTNRPVILSRRDLSAIHVLMDHIDKETKRIRELRRTGAWMFAEQPSFGVLLSTEDDGLNKFFRDHQNFDSPVGASQVGRIVRRLRSAGLVYDSANPDDRQSLGNEWALIPKPSMKRLHTELVRRYGTDPLRWPDSVAYDPESQRAAWHRKPSQARRETTEA